MSPGQLRFKRVKTWLMTGAAVGAVTANALLPAVAAAATAHSPIEHVIVIIGENRTFDHVFATYKPATSGETVSNLLSKGIVNADGTPGPHYSDARQLQATDTETYELNPVTSPYSVLPPALVGGPSTPYVCQIFGVTTGTSCINPLNLKSAADVETGLAPDYVKYLLTGGNGQPAGGPDARLNYDGHDASHLPPGPYQITSKTMPYDSYNASPVHRFYQMWQEENCDAHAATAQNPSGCAANLFPWVETTVAAGANGAARPAGYTGEGSTAMGFYNMQQGDAPYLKLLADTYTINDNYHQPVDGGTGANHIMMGTGDAVFFTDANGNSAEPPDNGVDPRNPTVPVLGKPNALTEVEDPNPQPGTNNFYIQDGYGGGSGSPANGAKGSYGGGSYVECSNPTQPGVPAVTDYLSALPRKISPNCEPGHYYLLNNYNPGYFGTGINAYTDTTPANTVFTVPPSTVPNIGQIMTYHNLTWAYYGDQFNRYLSDKYFANPLNQYCNICNWAQYSTAIMTSAEQRTAHLKDTLDLYTQISNGTLPAVAYVKPSGFVDGHPGSSKLDLFEGFVKKIVDGVKANPTLYNNTAIFITFDEGGGYYDSGYVQPLDFFGDGTRIPLIVVSKYATGGHVSHTYSDHVSIAKFIEANWYLGPISKRSRDNDPNPKTGANPYVPLNSPAIGDLFDMFNFAAK